MSDISTTADPMPGMSGMNRTIAYSAADKLRELGYQWDGEAWVTQAKPVAWQQQRKPLTVGEIKRIAMQCDSPAFDQSQTTAFARAIERAHGIKEA